MSQQNNHYFRATLSALIELSDAEFDLIWKNASRHYDGTVRSSVQVGGFIYGYRNRRNWALERDDDTHEYKIVDVKNSEIQLIMKACERDYSDESLRLSSRLFLVLAEMNKRTAEINSEKKYGFSIMPIQS